MKNKSRMIVAVAALLFLTVTAIPAKAADNNITVKTGYLELARRIWTAG